MECNCDMCRDKRAKETLHSLSVQQQEEIQNLFFGKKFQERFILIELLCGGLGIIIGMAMAALILVV